MNPREVMEAIDAERRYRRELEAEIRLLRSLWQDEELISRLFDAHMRGDVRAALRKALEGGPGALVGADAGTAQHNTTNPERRSRGET